MKTQKDSQKNFKKVLACVLTFIMCLSVFSTPIFGTTAKAYGETFIIDPGHGGDDPGALGSNPYREEKVDALNLSLRVGQIVSQYASVTYTRTNDATLSLAQRSSMANAGGHSYIISIHRNAYSDPAANGLETWWYSGTFGGQVAACQRFATEVYNGVMEQVPVWRERGVKDGNLHMCRVPTMPSCLIETGFITNNNDNAIFDQYFEQIAFGIAKGMLAMIGIVPNGVPASDKQLEGTDPINLGDDFYAYVKQSSTGLFLTNSNNNVCVAKGVDNGTQKWRFVRQVNGGYSLSTDGSTYWMDVTGRNYQNGTNIQMAYGNGNDSQKFYVYYIGGNFYLKSMYDNRMIDVDTSTSNVQLFGQETNTTNRAFEILKISLDYDPWSDMVGTDFQCYIRNSASDLFLTAEGDNAIFKSRDYSTAQKWTITRNEFGGHVIKSVLTGKVLDVADSSLNSGADINLYTENGSKAQSFFFIHAGESTFYIKPSYTNTVMDMDASSREIHSMSYGTSNTHKNAQIFEIISDHHIGEDMVLRPSVYVGDTFYGQITSEHTEYVLTANGSSVSMAENKNAENQIWKFELDTALNAYKITSNTGKVLDVTGAYYSSGTSIGLWESNNTPSQRFRFYETEWGYIISPAHTQKVVDVESMDNVTVQLYGSCVNDVRLFSIKHLTYNDYKPVDFGESFVSTIKNTASGLFIGGNTEGVVSGGASADKWKFTRQPDGSYVIENVNVGKVFDIKSGSISSGATIQLYEANGTSAQSFFIYETYNGGYSFMSAKSGRVIDMDASSKACHMFDWGTSDNAIAAQTFTLPQAPEAITPDDDMLTLKDTSSYVKEETFVTKINEGDVISSVISQFKNTGVEIIDANGNVISANGLCGTGYKITLVKDGRVIDSLTAVVSGDVDGNCKIDSTDYLRIKSVFLGTFELDGASYLAADMDDNNKIDSTDYLKIKSIFLGK